MRDFLEVQRLNQGKELIFCILDGIIDQLVREEHWIVSHLNLTDGFSDAHFKFLLSLNSVANPTAQLFKTWRVNEQKVALVAPLVDFQSTFDIDLNDWNFAWGLDALQFCAARAVPAPFGLLPELNKLIVVAHLLEIIHVHELKVFLTFLIIFADGPGSHTTFAVKNISILLKHWIDESPFTDTGWPDQNQWFVLLRRGVEWVEILFRVDKHIVLSRQKEISKKKLLSIWLTYRFWKEYRGEEIVENLANLQMLRNILVMLLHQLVFPRRQVRKHLIVKVHVRFHDDIFKYQLIYYNW